MISRIFQSKVSTEKRIQFEKIRENTLCKSSTKRQLWFHEFFKGQVSKNSSCGFTNFSKVKFSFWLLYLHFVDLNLFKEYILGLMILVLVCRRQIEHCPLNSLMKSELYIDTLIHKLILNWSFPSLCFTKHLKLNTIDT